MNVFSQGLTIQSASASRFHGFPPCANAILPPVCLGEREKEGEGERESERMTRLLAVVIAPLHKIPFALPVA